jgi:vacuolar-type H+-ATPase subunit H
LGDSLKDLLSAETEAEDIVSQGEKERDAIIRKALADAADMEKRFRERLPDMRQSFLDKARQHAGQTIAELKLRNDERNKHIRELAERHEDEAVELALKLLLDLERDPE